MISRTAHNVFLSTLLLASGAAYADGPGGGDGDSPGGGGGGGGGDDHSTAVLRVPSQYPTIQDAVDAAYDGSVIEISSGTYTGNGYSVVDTLGKRLTLKGVGDIWDPMPVINGQGTRHCIVCDDGETSNTIIQGLHLSNGRNGIRCGDESSPTVINCYFSDFSFDNEGIWVGGWESHPLLSNCTFSNNEGTALYIDYDGGVSADACTFSNNTGESVESRATGGLNYVHFTDCLFENNTSLWEANVTIKGLAWYRFENCVFDGNNGRYGGAVNARFVDADFVNCTFTGNTTSENGGAVYALRSSSGWCPEFVGCTFSKNTAGKDGGALYVDDSDVISPEWDDFRVRDCSFSNNTAVRGGAVYVSNDEARFTGCIITGNTASVGAGLFQGHWIDGNVQLQLLDTRVCGNHGTQIAGDWSDLGGNHVNDLCEDPNSGGSSPDINGDDIVNGEDMAYMLGAWDSDDVDADLDGDGLVGGADLSILLGAWN